NLIVWGRGISDEGVRIGDTVKIHVESINSLTSIENGLRVKVINGIGVELPVQETRTGQKSTFSYTPIEAGIHRVLVTRNSEPLGQSPYKVNVSPATKSRVRAFGPGLEGGVVKQQSVFCVETNGDADRLAFSIEGPSKTEITCQDRGKEAALVSFTPNEAGVYKVNVLSGGEHIHASPFVVNVKLTEKYFEPSAAKLLDLQSELDFIPDKAVQFLVDTQNTGVPDDPVVEILDSNLTSIATIVSLVKPNFYAYSFIPKKSGKYHVIASLRGVAIPGSPYPVSLIGCGPHFFYYNLIYSLGFRLFFRIYMS
ncbi:Filamin/ABP280 repeat protein, partial [Dictyocaulus viviparus]